MAEAYAKLNLTLDILGKRSDGYHDMRMIMQEISLCDTLTINMAEDPGIRLRSNLAYLPCDDSNIVAKAARILAASSSPTSVEERNLFSFSS